ncbi:MAG: phosphotransferase enzyme family protein [Puniceicoccaceae bacterium]
MSTLPAEVLVGFSCRGTFLEASRIGSGHINETYLASYVNQERVQRYVHQRINDQVFKDVPILMQNIGLVTRHLGKRMADEGCEDINRRALQLVPTKDGKDYLTDESGKCWRTFTYLENARSIDVVESPQQAAEVARAFGQFQSLLADIPERLQETIPGFHDTRARFNSLMDAVDRDPLNRATGASEMIAFARDREPIVGSVVDLLASGELPERVIHNDTKPNNVLFDASCDEALCVVDLDTVMPGTVLYDFGDMVRSTACAVAEDTDDLAQVDLDLQLYENLVRGYLETAGDFLTRQEKSLLTFSGRLIALELGMRFLKDHLSGDSYFKAGYEGQNLFRCRRQFAMAAAIERKESAMENVVNRYT